MNTVTPEPRRPSWLWMLVPGIVLAGVYVFAVRIGLENETRGIEGQIVSLRANTPSPVAVEKQTDRVAALTRELDAARERALASANKSDGPAVRTEEQKAKWRDRIAAVLERHSLELLVEVRGETEVGPQVDVPHWDAVKGNRAQVRVPMWRLELSGNYLNMLAALKSLRGEAIGARPLRVEMAKATGEEDPRRWTLTVTPAL